MALQNSTELMHWTEAPPVQHESPLSFQIPAITPLMYVCTASFYLHHDCWLDPQLRLSATCIMICSERNGRHREEKRKESARNILVCMLQPVRVTTRVLRAVPCGFGCVVACVCGMCFCPFILSLWLFDIILSSALA